MKLSIVIPAYNEEKTIREILEKINSVDIDKEIIVVDDGSTDNSVNVAIRHRARVVRHKKNKGKGAAIISGAKKATPFAAAKVAEKVLEKAKKIQFQNISIRVSGVGSGRDAAVRAFANHGLNILSIKDTTPIPHNGPRPKKVRRV